jgi:hypothetical protein
MSNPSLYNAILQIEKRISQNLPVGMTNGSVHWIGTNGFNPESKSKWARSSFTELDTTSNSTGWSRVEAIYTLQLFYKTPSKGSVRNEMMTDIDALKSLFSLKYFDNVTITRASSQFLGLENEGVWYNQNLILNFTCEGRI